MKTKLAKRMLALFLAMVMTVGVMPLTAFAEETPAYSSQVLSTSESVELPAYIFSNSWNTEYDVLYHEDGKSYTYNGQDVTFPDENTVNVGSKSYTIKNAVTSVTVETKDGKTEIKLSNLKDPVGSIDGLWNSGWEGRFALHYQLDGNPVSNAEVDRISRVKLTVDTPEAGTYKLTGGKIFEGANTYSQGFDFQDGKGEVTEREFGYLPDITFEVKSAETPEPPTPSKPDASEAPFTAKIGDQVLTVTKRAEREFCDATYKTVDVYDITVPADATKFMLCGLGSGYTYNAEGITGGDVFFDGDIELDIEDSTFYHIMKGWSSGFHIYFIREKETGPVDPEPSTPPAPPAIDAPFTAKIGDQVLKVENGGQEYCGKMYSDVPVYTLVIPSGETAKTFTLYADGLSYIKGGGCADRIWDIEGSVELDILQGKTYHLRKGWESTFHIGFRSEDDVPSGGGEPEKPAIPITAKIGDTNLTVERVDDVRCEATYQNVPVYQITIPDGTTQKTLSISGAKGWGYSENTCIGASDGTVQTDVWETNILGADQYYHMSKYPENYHITFKHLGNFEPEGPVIPFTAKAGSYDLAVVKSPRGGNWGNDLYTVQVPAAVKSSKVQLGGLSGLLFMKNELFGQYNDIPADPWETEILDKGGFYLIYDSSKNNRYEIRFEKEQAPSVSVSLTGQMDGAFLLPPETMVPVEAGLAGFYGYTYGDNVTENDVTALDALVKMHQIVFGEEDVSAYLAVNESGWITKAFGVETGNLGFLVNGAMTNTLVHETILEADSRFDFFNYQDTASFSDKQVWLEQNGQKQTHFDAGMNRPLMLTVKSADYNGNESAVAGVQLATVDKNGNTTPIDGAVTDQDGKVFVTFDKPGDYTVTVLSSDTTKVIMPIVHVAVSKGSVGISVEARTIGEGDLLEQVFFPIKTENTTAKDILDTAAAKNGLTVEYDAQGLVQSVNGFGADGEHSWRCEINGKVIKTAMDQQTVSDGDVIRVRYAATSDGAELNAPLYDYLKKLVQDAKAKLNGAYTEDSKAALQTAIDNAEAVLADSSNNSTDADKECLISHHIGAINQAVANLIEKDLPVADSSIPDDFENDLWLQYNYLEMKVGGKATIYPRRVPQIIDSAISNNVTRPNFHFEIVRGDSITLSGTESTKQVQVNAVRDGISIVKVTYDALGNYGACSSVNTAYVVYDVNSDPANLKITTSLSDIRSYDTLYYTDGETLPYSFSVNVPGASKVEVTCNDHVLTAGEDGSYTAQLENRSNILGIRATDENGKVKTSYHVIDARKIKINIENLTHPGKPFQINDKAKISFYGITMPVYKLAKIYNPCFGGHDDLNNKKTWPTSVSYQNDQLGELHGFCGQWDLATRNSFEVTLEEEGVYNFTNGQILCNWWGSPLGADKEQYGDGDPNFAAPILSDHFSALPDFSITVGEHSGDNVPVKGITLNKTELTLNEGEKFQLVATLNPENVSNHKVTWTCDDANGNFITVDKTGEVVALHANNDQVPFVTVTATTDDGGFTAKCKVIVTKSENPAFPPVPPAPESKENVVLSIEAHTIDKGYIAEPVELKLQKGDTVYTVLQRYAKEHNIPVTASYNSVYGSFYVSAIDGIAEMDYGSGSGWMYFVNEKKPEVGASNYTLEGGEVIRWRYTTNLGADLKPGQPLPDSVHSVTAAQAENGTITVPADKVKAGDSVTITVTANAGYSLSKLTVTDQDGTAVPVTAGKNGQFTFVMPASDVKVAAEFKKISTDIPDYKNILEETGKNLSSKPNSFGGEWVAMGLARHPYPVSKDYFDNYYKSVENYVKEKKGVLSTRKYTEYSRTILALTAAGYDVTNVGGYDLTAPLADFDKVNFQGINGTIFALIALDSGNYKIPAAPEGKTQTTRENLVQKILDSVLPDGGWSLSGDKANIDTTAMAIQALAPYYASNEAVKAAVDQALELLSQMQGEDGNWLNQDGEACSETPSQVLVALTAMGIDPAADARFIKNGRTVIDAICDFYLGNGQFSHTSGAPANGMATEQAYYALVSYLRFTEGKTHLYDMSDVTIQQHNPDSGKPVQPSKPGKTPNTGDESPIYLMVTLMVVSILGMALVLKKKQFENS